MKADIKNRWLERLRSGEYPQTTDTLCAVGEDGPEGWCCLGVLSEIAVEDGIVTKSVDYRGEVIYTDVEPTKVPWHNAPLTDASTTTLTRGVMAWSGLDAPNPFVKENTITLADMNDGGASFVDIADVIEDEL